MSERKGVKLGKLRLNEQQKQAIAEMVETDGFRIWERLVVPTREVEIGGLVINTAMDSDQLWYYKGMSYENSRVVKSLRDIADEFNKTNGDVDTD